MYLLVTKRTIHHEGDERSRTHPGHGYPAYSEDVDQIQKFEETADGVTKLEAVIKRFNKYETYELYRAEKCSVTTKVLIDIK